MGNTLKRLHVSKVLNSLMQYISVQTDGEVGNWYLKKVELVIGQYLFIYSIKFIGLFNLLDYVQHTIVRGTPPVSNYRHTKQTTVLKIYTIIQYYYMASIRFDESRNLIGQFEVRILP